MPPALPIDATLPEICRELQRGRNLVIEAPPGAGKTTRVPPALLAIVSGGILVLEPRRIAARMAARRVAQELGESLGETVGYQVRFDEVAGPRTRLRFLTEGVLTRRMLADPELRGVSAVILDEFHERHLEADLALALLRRLQHEARPELKLIVMSATLEATPIAEYLDGCAIVRSKGRLFDVEICYAGHSGAPLEEQVAGAVGRFGRPDGDSLVFLPGALEIRRAMRACEPVARSAGLVVLPLHGDLAPEDQDRAVMPSAQPKLILSTNVAESSITIDGVTTVIDSGLARIASDSPETGLPTLDVRRISKASAIQRAGRAGRTRPGRAVRLFSLDDFVRRQDHDTPEIRRRELSQTVLELRAMRVTSVPWFEPPPEEAWSAAEELLDRLGAREQARELARYPLHPRLARLILEASKRGAAGEACRLAAILSAGDRFDCIDILDMLEREPSYNVQRIERQIRRIVRPRDGAHSEEALRIALLSAYPDRVGRRRTPRDVQLAGRPAQLAAEYTPQLLVAIDIEDRREAGPPLIRAASAVQPEWLLDLFPGRIRESDELTWNREAERVEATSALLYDNIPIDESRGVPKDLRRAGDLLAQRALDAGLQRFVDVEALEEFLARVLFAARHSDVPELTDDDVRAALTGLAGGLRSFTELKQAAEGGGLIAALKSRLGRGGERTLNEVAPERLPLKNRQVRVHYVRDQQPWIASRLQDFFGIRETPRIARGQVPLVVHLLAPSQRPVQMTSDLAGFWDRLYPQVRRELCRKYPKHAWPEKPDRQ